MSTIYHATGQQSCCSVEYETDNPDAPKKIWLQRKLLRQYLTPKNWITLGQGNARRVPATITITITS